MERLTDNTDYCTSWSDCEMPDGKCEFLNNCYDRKIYNKLREYEDAEEQGLLIRLPCKVGDEFWELNTETKIPYIYSRIACSLNHCEYVSQRLGKTVFLTKAEAEKALERIG